MSRPVGLSAHAVRRLAERTGATGPALLAACGDLRTAVADARVARVFVGPGGDLCLTTRVTVPALRGQVRALAIWDREQGRWVITTVLPGNR